MLKWNMQKLKWLALIDRRKYANMKQPFNEIPLKSKNKTGMIPSFSISVGLPFVCRVSVRLLRCSMLLFAILNEHCIDVEFSFLTVC